MRTSKLNLLNTLGYLALGFVLTFCEVNVNKPEHSLEGNNPGSDASDRLNLVFFENFEGDKPFSEAALLEVGDWDYAMNIVTDPVFRGKKSVRFEIREDQPLVKRGKRSEVSIIKGLPSREMWYSFAIYFPSDGFEEDNQREVLNQWYQNASPATSFRARHDRLLFESGAELDSRERIDMGPITKDTWHEVVFHFIHSHKDDGLAEVWYDGKKIITRHGGNMYDDVLPKWKIGLYKDSFKHGTSIVSRRVVYFDNIKVGSSENTYEDMIPSND